MFVVLFTDVAIRWFVNPATYWFGVLLTLTLINMVVHWHDILLKNLIKEINNLYFGLGEVALADCSELENIHDTTMYGGCACFE